MKIASIFVNLRLHSTQDCLSKTLFMIKTPSGSVMYRVYTVNVDIFACIHFCGFMKMGNFARIEIRALCITGSKGYYKSNLRSLDLYTFVDI